MKLIKQHSKLRLKNPSLITIGKFDGLHLGHVAIIKQVLATSKKLNLEPIVMLLEPHPVYFFSNKKNNCRLMNISTKIKTIQQLGINSIIILPFRYALANTSASDFIEKVLLQNCNCKYLIVGDEFRFGKNQAGDLALLQQYKSSFKTQASARVGTNSVIDNKAGNANDKETVFICSSMIKQLLANNEINIANKLLGRNYAITGRVVAGYKRGKQLGFPTANIHLNFKSPLAGIYYGTATTADNKTYNAVTSIGKNPTFANNHSSIEVHLIEQTLDLYNTKLTFTPLSFIRAEQKYQSETDLIKAIEQDIVIAKINLI